MSEKLLPCPFCGGEAILKEISDRWAVYCAKGCAGTQIFNDKRKPVEAWNRRTERTGRWVDIGKPITGRCSECDHEGNKRQEYCGECGAHMIGGEDDN